jgi:hypothetical protein
MGIYETLQELRTGPGQFRFILQPLVAIVLAIRDGRTDARLGAKPYLLAVLEGERSGEDLRQGFRQISTPFAVAFFMDAAIQICFLHRWRPLASLVVALILIALPYSVMRGLANRAVRRIRHIRYV